MRPRRSGRLRTLGRPTGAGFVLNPLHAVAPTFPWRRRIRRRAVVSPARCICASPTSTPARGRPGACPRRRAPPRRDGGNYRRRRLAGKKQALGWPAAGANDRAPSEPAIPGWSFARFALVERHGPDWRAWPGRRSSGRTATPSRSRPNSAPESFWRGCRAVPGAARRPTAAAPGMPIGIVHDLAVGVDRAEPTLDAGRCARRRCPRRAPPDSFNQLGQDRGLAAWHPIRSPKPAALP
jgi:4-alpha-glucanotransferase